MLHVVSSHDSRCFSPFNFETMRLGPSASEVHEHKLDALVKSLSHIQSVLEDPAMREVIGNLAPQLLDLSKNHEMADAHAGKPASSNPGKRTSEMAPPAAPPTKSAKTMDNKKKMNGPNDEDPAKTSPAPKPDPAKTSPATKPDEDPDKTSPASKPGSPTVPDETSPGETEINSSTHRAAHARLVRRMEKLPVAEFPNMSRLWNGSRKETRYILNHVQFFGSFLQDFEELR